MKSISAFISGLIFGIGLIVAGMANPAKVLGFLDIAGRWDPSLAFVMLGAIGISFFAFRLARRNRFSVLNGLIKLPAKTEIDWKLIGGSLLFGIGWGLAGICPGPSLVLLGAGEIRILSFIAAMLLGFFFVNQLNARINSQ
ncbi:MAG: YeeE/YedE family protein [Verrucomicrobiaceae bacterium]|nr:YeeE/YedE family protein [Verrucomicrobiaceae bacterium]